MADKRSLALRSNIHAHSTYSDGHNSCEEMVLAAIARGFVSFGLSDHGYAPHDVCSMSRGGEARYRAEMLRLREKYAGRIELALGYEHDASMPEADLSPYDYVIESVHFLRRGGEYTSIDASAAQLQGLVDLHYAGDVYAMCSDYFESVCRSIMDTPGQIVGHIGLVSKFNEDNRMFDAASPRYLRPAREALRCAVERDLLVEVNTGAMSRGYRSEPYPGRTLLKHLREIGGRITLTTDCHRAEWVDYGLAQAAQLALSCGFTESWIWRSGTFEPVPLEA